MKKILGIILVLLVISGAAFYVYQNLSLPKVESLESITPEGVIYYIYSDNPDKKIKDFQASAFSKQITENAFFKKSIQPELDKIQKQIPFLSDFLQQDAAVAIYSLTKQPVGDVLVLTRINQKKNMKLKKALADYYLSLGGKTEVNHKNYRGIKISDYKLPDKDTTISCAFVSDVIVVSNNKDIVKKSIDIYKDKLQNNLLNAKNFRKLAAKIKKDALFWIFVDNQSYAQDILRTYETNQPADGVLKMKSWAEMMNVFEGYVAYMDYDSSKTGLVTKIYQNFNNSASNQEWLNLINYDLPIDKNTFNLGLENTIAYYGGSQNLVDTWKLIRKFAASIDEVMKAQLLADPKYAQYKDQINAMGFDAVINMTESFLGINIENDLLSGLANNFGVIFAGFKDRDIQVINNASDKKEAMITAHDIQNITVMFPQIYLFAELKDSMQIQKTMEIVSQQLVENINKVIPTPQSQADKQKKDSSLEDAVPQPQEIQNPPEAEEISPPEDVSKQEEVQNKPEPEESFKLLNIKTEDYNGITLRTIAISHPEVSFLAPTYCVLDKYLIFSLSPDITKEVVDIWVNKTNSFSSNPEFRAVKDKILTDYSNFLFFNFRELIENIRSTKAFNEFESADESKDSQARLSKDDINSFLDILSNIDTFTFTNKVTEPDVIETDCYLKIKGL